MVSQTSRLRQSIALLALTSAFATTTASAQSHFTNCASNTGNNASLFVSTAINPNVNGRFLANGDEIAVFTPEGLCAGVKVWDGTNTAVTVWGDDSITGAKDGFAGGDSIKIHVWDSRTDVEFWPLNADIDVQYDSGAPFRGSPTYQSDALYNLTRLLVAEKTENRAPVASFTATAASSFDPYEMAFDGSASVDIDGTVRNYLWNFGDGNTASGPDVTHTYFNGGSYTVSLSVTDDDGAVGAATAVVNITEPTPPENITPSASFTVSPAADGNGLKVNVDAASSSDPDGSISSYTWNFGDSSSGTGRTASHTYASGGTYTIRLTVRDNDNATGTSTASITLTDPEAPVNQQPVASFTAVPTGAADGMEFEFDGYASIDPDGSISTYRWNFGDGATNGGPNSRHTFAAAGTFTVRLTVTDNQGATGTATANITVTAPPPPDNRLPSASFSASQVSGGDPYTVRVDGSSSFDPDGTIASYAWNFGDGTTGTGVSASHTYAGAGSYEVVLTVTDNAGGTATSRATIQLTAPDPPANQAPLASFTAAPGTGDLEIDFDASSSRDTDGSISTYQWNFGDGTTGTGRTPSHVYSAAGTYAVSLTVTDNNGSVGAATASVKVTAPEPPPSVPPSASFTASPASGSDPYTIRFDASASSDADGSVTSYAWTFGDGNSATGATPNHTYAAAGSYTVTLTVTDNDGNTGRASATIQITAPDPVANQAPAASFAASPISGGDPYSMRFDASASSDPDGSIASYSWSFGDGSSGPGMTASHTYAGAGTYLVTLTVTDNQGKIGRASVSVELTQPDPPANQAPSASFTAAPGASAFDIDFDASASTDGDGSIASYRWDFGDGSNGTGRTTSHTYSADGTYTVRLTVTDNDGAISTASASVRISAPETVNLPPSASFTAAAGVNDLEIVLDGSASSDPDGNIVSYRWNFGDGQTGFGRTATHAYVTAGSYAVSLTVTDDKGGVSTASATVHVTAPESASLSPAASFTAAPLSGAPQPFTMRFNGGASFDPDGSIASYAWDFGDGSTGTGQLADHSYPSAGTYDVTLTVTDNEGNTGSASATIGLTNAAPDPNQPPVASFTASTGSTDFERVFDAASSTDTDGSITSFRWNFGDGSIGEGATATHLYGGEGDFVVTLTIVDDDGSVGTASATIKVTAPKKKNLPPTASLTARNKHNSNLSVELNGSSSYDSDGSISTFEWEFGDGSSGEGAAIAHTYAQSGLYTVTMRVTDNDGASSIATVNLDLLDPGEENLPPSSSFTATQNNTEGDYVMNFDASASVDPDGSISTYLWSFGDGSTQTGQRVTHDFGGAGEYSVSLTVTDNRGSFGTSSTSLTLTERVSANVPPAAGFTAMPGTDSPFRMAFDASPSLDTDGTIQSYLWDFGDGSSAEGQTASHNYGTSGTYIVKLFVTDDKGNVGTATATVNLLDPAKNSVPTASFKSAPLEDVSPVAVVLDASGSFDIDGAIGAYLWDFGDGKGGSGKTVSHEYDASGSYVVTLTITDNGGSTAAKSDTVSVRFTLPPHLDLARIGRSAMRGYAEYQGDVLSIESGGSLTTKEEDEFSYVYSPLTADGEITARIVSLDSEEPWAAVGVMIRERLTAGSRFVSMTMTEEHGGSFQLRSAPSTKGTRQTPGIGFVPYWVRLVRKANTITGYMSIDGERWKVMGEAKMDLPTDVFIGVAAASNSDSVMTYASVDQIVIVSTEPEPVEIPTEYELSEMYPNPFNPQTHFKLVISQEEHVKLQVFDAIGRLIRTIHNDLLVPNTQHEFVVDAEGLPSGLYILRAVGDSFSDVRKAILLK